MKKKKREKKPYLAEIRNNLSITNGAHVLDRAFCVCVCVCVSASMCVSASVCACVHFGSTVDTLPLFLITLFSLFLASERKNGSILAF